GARRPFFVHMATPHDTERALTREVGQAVESGVPGVEVLAVELSGPDRFCVSVDHPAGVDHALCERVTNVLRGYLDRYSIDVSSPGVERPLRKPAHFANAVGRQVAVRTAQGIAGRRRFRGEVLAAGDQSFSLGTVGAEAVVIPYDEVVRGNVIDEG